MRTFLTTVLIPLFLDDRNRAWAQWRPSPKGEAPGTSRILLERLTGPTLPLR